jgi:hypothetical protein
MLYFYIFPVRFPFSGDFLMSYSLFKYDLCRMLCGYLSVPFALPTPLEPRRYMPPKRAKGKTTISKPTRGSGLNPSHLPAGSQLNLDDEQPREPMAHSFNPHARYVFFFPSQRH